MSMSVGNTSSSGEPEVMMDINTTPLIDVMLVLLIMLIITIPIQLHAVNLDLPVGTPPQQNVLPNIVKIDIDERNKVFFNGELMPDTVEVDRRLRDMSLLPLAAQPELHLRPDKRSRYETVVAVMAAVQRFGLTKFGIVGAEQFIE